MLPQPLENTHVTAAKPLPAIPTKSLAEAKESLNKEADKSIIQSGKEIKTTAKSLPPTPTKMAQVLSANPGQTTANAKLACNVTACLVYKPLEDIPFEDISVTIPQDSSKNTTISQEPTPLPKAKQEDLSAKQKLKLKLGPKEYKEFKKEMLVIHKFVHKNMDLFTETESMKEVGSTHTTKENLKNILPADKYIKKLKDNGIKYGLTVTKSGEIYIDIPASQFAKGGEKSISFAVKLCRPNPIAKLRSQFSNKIKSSKISAFGASLESSDKENVKRNITGDIKVMNAPFKDSKHILIPRAVTLFEEDENYQTGSITHFCEGGDLRNKFFDLNTEAGFKEFKKTARGMLKPISEFHEAGLYHCDIKPENYMIKDGDVMLGDFGNVKNNKDLEGPVLVFNDACNANLNSIEKNANTLHQENPEIKEKYENMKSLINASPLSGKHKRKLDENVRNAACDYRNALLENSKALNKQSLDNILTQLNLFIFKKKVEEFHKTSTLAYTSPELLSTGLTDFQLTQPLEAAKCRDLYAYGMSLFQMTHPISSDVIEHRFIADVKNDAKNLGVDINQNIETIIYETNEKQKEFIIESVGEKCKSDEIPRLKEIGITSDTYKKILSEKSYSELNEIYKLIAPAQVIIQDYKQRKEDIKLEILPEMAKEFVNHSKNHPPAKGSPDEIMLKLLSEDPQKRGTVKDTLKMLDKMDFRNT